MTETQREFVGLEEPCSCPRYSWKRGFVSKRRVKVMELKRKHVFNSDTNERRDSGGRGEFKDGAR